MNPCHMEPESLAALARALESRAGGIELVALRAWHLPVAGCGSSMVSVSVDDTWVHFQSPLPGRRNGRRIGRLPSHRRATGLLVGNAYLPEGMSFCVGSRGRSIYLTWDVLLHDVCDGKERWLHDVQLNYDRFCSALRANPFELAAAQQWTDGLQQPLTVDDEAGNATRAFCQNLGWEYHERGNGQLAMTLNFPGQFYQAFAYLVGDGEYRLGAILETLPDLSHTSRHAMAMFLLSASRMVRLARATVISNGISKQYRWEVAWARFPSETQFDFGLTALSIASRLSQRELQALGDDSIAVRYINLRRRSSQ